MYASRDFSDVDNFADLLSTLSKVLRQHDLEFSAMVSANPEIAALAYKPHILSTELDWISVAANDFYASNTGRASYLMLLDNNQNAGINSMVSTHIWKIRFSL